MIFIHHNTRSPIYILISFFRIFLSFFHSCAKEKRSILQCSHVRKLRFNVAMIMVATIKLNHHLQIQEGTLSKLIPMKKFKLIFQLVSKTLVLDRFPRMSEFCCMVDMNTLKPIPNHSLKSMCLRSDLANFVLHDLSDKILPPLNTGLATGLLRDVVFRRMQSGLYCYEKFFLYAKLVSG